MKVLIDHAWPFALAHGGLQIQIEQTKAALEARGIKVEYLRWWDSRQSGDIIHYFGRPTGGYIDSAQAKGMKVVVAELHTALGSRSAFARFAQKSLMRISRTLLPQAFTSRLAWDAYQKADAFIANTEWEAHLMRSMFDADPAKIHIIANGVEDVFFLPSKIKNKKPRSDYLVCTATIHPRKRVLELAEAAVEARVPLRVIGKPYADSDSYYLRFVEIQKNHPDLIRYDGEISDRSILAKVYQESRGFVLLSTMETHSLSAFEATAAQCPLFLSDLPWARSVFGSQATYLEVGTTRYNAAQLRLFYEKCPGLPASTVKPCSWDEIAAQFAACYRSLLAG